MTNLPPSPDSNGDTGVGPGRRATYSTPRWVKVFGIILLVLILLFAILQIASGGEHGPSRHSPTGGDPGSRAPLSSATEDHASSGGGLVPRLSISSFSEQAVQ